MVGLSSGDAKTRLVASMALAMLAVVAVWLSLRGSALASPRDFEECVEALQASPPVNDERGGSMTDCNARFAGRRKADGGYTYYDFMQARNFDIAGPNPTAEEHKQIDREYMGFLDTQRRETVSAELAKRQNEQLQADLERERQPVGPPLVLTPRNPSSPAAKQSAVRSKSTPCEDNSLACGWSKLSAVVKNTFASSSGTKP
jgi:hypothetical protein